MGVSIPADPAKKAALKEEMQDLLQHIAIQNGNSRALQETRQAVVSKLQVPAENDVIFALKQARQALTTNLDIEGAIRTLELTRGRDEEAIRQTNEILPKI